MNWFEDVEHAAAPIHRFHLVAPSPPDRCVPDESGLKSELLH